ncbi:DUF305 domain-containing protein [Streptosporangium sp. NBC_01755]|nr:DUF305 domain-containing protein [Streptosporangium sp. NBC_01755]WSA28494.1 DUF305 domain-containing protein [Streptosporangium sp. NBC_01810]
MTTEEDMGKLQTVKGTRFDRMFSELMIAHHRGSDRDGQDGAGTGSRPQGQGSRQDHRNRPASSHFEAGR